MNEKEEFLQMVASFRSGDILRKIGGSVGLLVVAAMLMFFLTNCLYYVRPNHFAIKQVNIGVRPGVRDKVYSSGFHVIAPFGVHLMHSFPRDIQAFEMNAYLEHKAKDKQFNMQFSRSAMQKSGTSGRGLQIDKAAHIQTSDGFYVDVDVTVLYHISDPYKLITTIGPGRLYEDNGIVPKVEPTLKETLGEMTTEQFFQSPLRVKKAEEARALLNLELNSKGITVDHVLIRYFKYSDEIQKNIEEKKLKDQLVFTNQSKARAATEEAKVKKVREEGEVNVRIRMEEGRAYAVRKIAEKDLYTRKKHAEGDLLMKLAEARRTELVNNAYQQKGSDKLVGLRMADVLMGLDVIVLPSTGANGFNPLDLEKSLRLFGIAEEEGKR